METITAKDLLKSDPALKQRPYQIEALLSIFLYEKCLVKMFCGTGKSRIITNVIIHEKKDLIVVVFPSLALISQYSFDYLNNSEYVRHFKKHKTLNVSSEKLENMESTTDAKEIKKFLKYKSPKIILVTYQSYQVLLDCLDGKKIGLVCYDEAHHVVSPETQKLVFGTDYYEKEVFFTATPKNENGITMFDREYTEKKMCGPVAYDYTYLQGLTDEVLNAFEICIDMYTENTNASIYEAMARAILAKGTSRVLSFHSGVNGESNTNVKNFVNEAEFKEAFAKVQKAEFPEKDYYTKITFKGMDGTTPSSERKSMLKALDDTPNNEIYIIASCETIGEGVDTKKANMCLFADPKSSITKIIQNIGRVVRRNKAHPLSTILIPCWVNMENYSEAGGDRVKQDELIRQQMRSEKGDYASILNVLGALRQEDPELYEMCLDYPNRRVKEESLAEQGFMIADIDEDDSATYSAEEVEQMKNDGEPLEIHTNETIERFNEDVEDETLRRLYHDEEEDVYKPIVRTDDENESDSDEEDELQIIQPPKQKSGIKMSIHQDDDIQMLWGVNGELDFSKKFCSAVINCEVSFGEEKWYNTLKKVCAYMDEHEKQPSTIDKSPAIKKLGSWLSHQKNNYAKNTYIMVNPAIRSEWEATLEKYGEYLADGAQQWRLTLNQVHKYMEEHQKQPSCTDKSPAIKKLGKWISHQKNNYAKNTYIMASNPDIRAEWESTLEKYKDYLFTDVDELWHSFLKQVCAYMNEHQKLPNQNNKNPEIKKLGLWIGRQKKNYLKNDRIMKNPAIRTEWESTLEKYRDYLADGDEQWCSSLKQVCEYMDEQQKRPSDSDKNPSIQKLGRWVSNQKKNYTKNTYIMKNPVIRAEWESTLEKYGEYLITDGDQQWRFTLKQVHSYMDDQNKPPSSADENPAIKKLGKWISHQKTNYAKNDDIMANSAIRAEWEATLEKYGEHLIKYLDEQWHLTLRTVCAYMDEAKKLPSHHNKNPAIKKLGTWVDTQKMNYKEKAQRMANSAIRAEWEATLEKYGKYLITDLDIRWRSTLKKVHSYMDQKQKSPSQSDENPEIKKLGKWVCTQKSNYVKNTYIIASNPDIRTEWEATLQKYGEYLNQSIIPLPTQPEAPPPKKRTIKIKKQTAIQVATTTATETTTPHHFPPPSEIGKLHRTYLKMRSDTLNAKFKSEPQLWLDYHAARKRNFATYDPASIPSNQIIQELEKIQTKRQKVVVDMGCGEAPIAHHFQNDLRFTFHNYDHQSGGDPLIQEVDISALPSDDASVEIGIMSLALWGTHENCTQYIKEAYRVLESGGKFYISDSTKKWSPEQLTPENGGELLRTLLTTNGFEIINENIGIPFCLFVCIKNY